MDWIDIRKEQPEKNVPVLCYSPSSKLRLTLFVSYRYQDEPLNDIHSFFYHEAPAHRVTHWMPLPPAPSEEPSQ